MRKLEILGKGCAKCATLGERTEAAAKALGIDYQIEKVTDINAIVDAGVMVTPALRVDGVIKTTGKVPSVDELKAMLG